MNPFDLPGPEFLGFYIVLGTAVTAALVWIRRKSETTSVSARLTDPYMIAYLRGGKAESLGVAAASLIDRNLLKWSIDGLKARDIHASDFARRPIEQAVLNRFKNGAPLQNLFKDGVLQAVAYKYEKELAELRLLPDEKTRESRARFFFGGLLVLWGAAITKILIALGRGRPNVLFLIGLAIAFALLAYRVSYPRRTRAGDMVLEDLRTLFAGLKNRARSLSPGGASNEATFLAAVFGLGALPSATFPFSRSLQPKPEPGASNDSWFSWWGAGSCGSSCGGGGCGGGCGGCGS